MMKITTMSKFLTLASLIALTLVASPTKAYAYGQVGDPATSKLSEIDGSPIKLEFNDNDPTRKNYYESGGRSNRMYLTAYKGFTFFGLLPPSALASETNNTSYGQMYENYYNTSGASSKIGSKVRVNDLGGETTGSNTEWRYLGYSSYGDAISNPYFPPDVTSSATAGSYQYDIHPWDYSKCPGGASIWDDEDQPTYYNKKLDALRKLIAQEPTMQSWDVWSWSPYLSLRTDPSVQSAVFIGTRGGGTYYRDLAVVGNVPNLRVVSETVRDKATGNIVGSYTRNADDPNNMTPSVNVFGQLEMDSEYTVTVQVKNMNDKTTTLDPSLLDVGYGTGKTFSADTTDYSDNQYQNTLSESGVYSPQSTKTFSWDFTVDSNFTKGARVTANIDGEHYLNGDNYEVKDDFACIPFKVDNTNGQLGNLGIDKIKLVGTDGKEYDRATPGQEYKIRYYVDYTGADVKKAIYRTETWTTTSHDSNGHSHTTHHSKQVFDHWEFPKQTIKLKAEIDRNVPNVYAFGDVFTETLSKTTEVHERDEYTFTTSAYRMYEVPVIRTTGTISGLSSIDQNDYSIEIGGVGKTLSAQWHEYYDFKVSNVRVLPVTETPYVAGYQTFAVQYDITNTAPDWLSSYEKDLNVMVALGGQSTSTKVHVAKGTNTNITQEMTVWVNPATDKTLTGTVTINYDKMTWEEDVRKQKNDQASATTSIENPYNPWSGPPVERTNNAWTQTYNIHNWTGVNKTYQDVCGSTHQFNLYTPGATSNQSKSQYENYKITSIKFRSKLTTDTNQGDNGWVELTSGTAGLIKAGYGYELQVTVNYNTNAFSQPQPSVTGSYSQNGTWVRPLNVTENLPNELFVKTPDGKILSVDGYSNTNAGLDYTVTGDRTNTTWTYTIKAKDTLGVDKTAPKVYIDPNTTDGTYNLQVFTPAINGVPTKTAGSKLCDSKTVQIKVQGADTDDLKSHITQ
jgi:hypothetical protein